jgi:nitrate/nitrite transport system permease protein
MQRFASALETCGFGWFAPLARLPGSSDRAYELRQFALRVGLPCFAIGVLLLTWHLVALHVHLGGMALPTPGLVWDKGVEQVREWRSDGVARAEHQALVAKTAAEQNMTVAEVGQFMPFQGKRLFVTQVWLSIETVFLGVGAGLLVAIPIGILCGLSGTIFTMANPLIQLFKPVSPLAWFPVVYLIINRVMTNPDPLVPKSMLIAALVVGLCSLWPALVNTANGVANVDKDHRNVARVLNLSWFRTVWSIVLPSAMPAIFTGIRVSLGVGWMVLIAAEMMAVSPGIGGFVWDWYQSSNDIALAYLVLAVIVIGSIGFFLDRLCITAQILLSRGAPANIR